MNIWRLFCSSSVINKNAVSFPTDEHLNVLSPSCSLLIGIMRPSCAAKKKTPAQLFPNLHGCLICV